MTSANSILTRLKWLNIAFPLATAGAVALTAGTFVLELDLYHALTSLQASGELPDPDAVVYIEAQEQFIGKFYPITLLFGIPAGLFWFSWLYNSTNLLRTAKIEGLEFSPLMSVVWQVIPVMQLWKSLHINIEIATATLGKDDWKQSALPKLAVASSFVIAIQGLAIRAYSGRSDRIDDIGEAISLMQFGFAVDFLTLLSAIAMVMFMRQMLGRQKQLVKQLSSVETTTAA